MQIHPLVPMRKAAALLGVDKDQLKAKLVSGEIRGEQRRVGSKDKWFVYSGEVSNRIDTERLPELMKRTMTDGQLALEVETVTEIDPLSLSDLDSFFEQDGSEQNKETAAEVELETAGEIMSESHLESISEITPVVTEVEVKSARSTPAKTSKSEPAEVKSGKPVPVEIHHIFESLTVVFAQRLSDEYQQRLIAEQKAKTAEARVHAAELKTKAYEENIDRLKQQQNDAQNVIEECNTFIADLELERDEAQYTIDERNSVIAELEQEMRELKKQLEAKKPSFWAKLFGVA